MAWQFSFSILIYKLPIFYELFMTLYDAISANSQLTNPYSQKPAFKFGTTPFTSTEMNLKKNYKDMYSYMMPYNKMSVSDVYSYMMPYNKMSVSDVYSYMMPYNKMSVSDVYSYMMPYHKMTCTAT